MRGAQLRAEASAGSLSAAASSVWLMTFSLSMVTFDSADPEPLARWWSERLGAAVIEGNDGFFYVLDTEPRVAVQKVEDPTPGKNRIHLDLTAADLDAARDEAIAAGATLVGEHTYSDFRWFVLADPQGNQFCIAQH